MGLQSRPASLAFNDKDVDGGSWSYDAEAKLLTVGRLNAFTPQGAWNSSWELAWA